MRNQRRTWFWLANIVLGVLVLEFQNDAAAAERVTLSLDGEWQ
jgi:hypothetical protein